MEKQTASLIEEEEDNAFENEESRWDAWSGTRIHCSVTKLQLLQSMCAVSYQHREKLKRNLKSSVLDRLDQRSSFTPLSVTSVTQVNLSCVILNPNFAAI